MLLWSCTYIVRWGVFGIFEEMMDLGSAHLGKVRNIKQTFPACVDPPSLFILRPEGQACRHEFLDHLHSPSLNLASYLDQQLKLRSATSAFSTTKQMALLSLGGPSSTRQIWEVISI